MTKKQSGVPMESVGRIIRIEDDAYYDLVAVSDLFGREVEVVRRYVRSGELISRSLGRKWYIKGIDLRNYIDNRLVNKD